MFELSFHQALPGCAGALAGALGQGGWAKAQTRALWRPVAGTFMGHVLSLREWPDFAARDLAFDAHAADPQWGANKARLQRSEEHWIVTPTAGSPAGFTPNRRSDGIHEIRVQQVVNGSQPRAAEAFWSVTAPEIVACGGQVLGQYDVTLGPMRPSFVTMLSWPDMATLDAGWQQMDRSTRILDQRNAEIAEFSQPLYERPAQYLMSPVLVGQSGDHIT